MNTCQRIKSIVLLGTLIVLTVGAPRSEAQSRRGTPSYGNGGNELVFEGGAAEPTGDQKDDFFTTDTGFNATTGYEIGLRYRVYLSPNWSIAPNFHYTRFGEFTGVSDFDNADQLGFTMRLSNYHYGLDLQTFIGSADVAVRPFLTGGIALINNRYQDQLEYSGAFQTSINTPAYSAGVGLKIKHIEISGTYFWNRFDTPNLSQEPVTQAYNWDYAVVRVGFAFGRY